MSSSEPQVEPQRLLVRQKSTKRNEMATHNKPLHETPMTTGNKSAMHLNTSVLHFTPEKLSLFLPARSQAYQYRALQNTEGSWTDSIPSLFLTEACMPAPNCQINVRWLEEAKTAVLPAVPNAHVTTPHPARSASQRHQSESQVERSKKLQVSRSKYARTSDATGSQRPQG